MTEGRRGRGQAMLKGMRGPSHAISRQAVLDMLEDINAETEGVGFYYKHYVEYIKNLPPVTPQYTDAEIQKMQDLEFAEIQKAYEIGKAENPNKWIPLTKRPMTDEEREYYREWSDIDGAMIFDCPLPEDGQEVLVSYGGYVMVDTFCKDDGCYFEGVDIDDVEAWMPLPEPYKASPTGAESEVSDADSD